MPIIEFAQGAELVEALGESTQMVAGMTQAEASAALKIVASEKIATAPVVKTGAQIIEFSSGSAAEAIQDFAAQGGTISASNAATQAASSSSFNVAQGLNAAGVSSVLGVLTIPLPTAAAAIAPLMGVSLGASLYYLAPDFWSGISEKLKDMCWKDTEVVPAVVDSNGQVYFSSEAFKLMSDVSKEIKKSLETKTSSLDLSPLQNIIASTSVTYKMDNSTTTWVKHASDKGAEKISAFNRRTATQAQAGAFTYAAPYPFEGSTSFTYNDKTVYYRSEVQVNRITELNPNSYDGILGEYESYSPSEIAWTMIYGESLEVPGLEEWTGDSVVDYTVGGINVVTDPETGDTEPYYPVTLPVGDPGVSIDPLIKPNPTTPNTAPDLTPYIPVEIPGTAFPQEIPVPSQGERTSPLETYVPNLEVNLDPSSDPSLQPEPQPDLDPYPDPPPPTSNGNSPQPIFPLPGEFPSYIPKSGSGLIHVYNPTPQELISFGQWLWVTYADSSIEKLWNNPFDGVIGAHELYATPETDGTDNIRSGFLTCPVSSNLVRQRYTTINCGSLVIPEFYANYLDYSPYSKAHIYLPFIGIVELNVDDIVGHGVNVTYHVDAYNGSCIAQITVAKSGYENTVYQFSGNCGVELPMAGGSQAAIRAGLIGAAATGITSVIGGVASIITGNVAGGIGGIAHGIGGAINQAVSQKSSVQHSGTFGASYGAMGIKKPYIIIHRPVQKRVMNYNYDYGFPAHKRVKIGNCDGYIRVREVHAVSATASDEEKDLIEKLLMEGVFVNDK